MFTSTQEGVAKVTAEAALCGLKVLIYKDFIGSATYGIDREQLYLYEDLEDASTSIVKFIDEEIIGEETRKNTLPWDQIMSLEYDTNLVFQQSIVQVKKSFTEKSKENLPLLFLQEDIDQISEQNKQTKLSLNYEKRKVKRDQFKKAIQDRRTRRLEELGYSDKDNFDEFASKTLMNEVLNTVVDLIESSEIESG